MSHNLPSPLPVFDRNLLWAVARIVPAAEREEWSCTWRAELWHMHHRGRNRRMRTIRATADLSIGLTCDALWLRTDCCSRALSGTPTLCLASLLALCFLSSVITLALTGNWHSLSLYLHGQAERSLVEAPFVVFVNFATASRRPMERSSVAKTLCWIRRQLFFVAEMALVLLLTFLLSADICHPIHAAWPATADLLQILFFVILTLIGLRWAFRDQEERCKQCLHSLAMPARVGRPSHNLLEWNGTELACKHGHGLLSVPEMESSWCRSSQWVDCKPRWEQAAEI
ncbi:MAG TPA: hypothetical protein VF865_07405 [Acidobacteriaceae bacterium]